MMNLYDSDDDDDVKPIILPKKWSPDLNVKSAFQPYKQSSYNTVLTNLQRGNTQAEAPSPETTELNLHARAGQGEITVDDLKHEQIDVLDANGLTCLHWASAYGQFTTVELLIKHDADIHKLGLSEESPLTLAACGGHHEVVKILLRQGADVNHIDHLCNTPLMYAAKGNHPHTCQELLERGADIALMNLNDETARDLAVAYNSMLAQSVIDNYIIGKLGLFNAEI